eukprot:CAMPEP_0115475066 /NCGR_PEP_ID=MMETSP0271-20121206/54420_1 /TAXON_ID=71861 /ORGANISM="Scrippsiella trochoidea, Strain CCMP3099" /LENGTH=46 /DNA_ID= /DNA_START= /DNA_END= /DNA_ORIENTATION=
MAPVGAAHAASVMRGAEAPWARKSIKKQASSPLGSSWWLPSAARPL